MLEYRVSGEGPGVLLVPSLGRALDDFGRLMTALADASFRVAAINPRGVGDSTGPTDGLTLHDFAADAAEVVERLELAPTHVVGHAWGNRVVRCLAVDNPELVRSVTLLAAGGVIGPGEQLRQQIAPALDWTAAPERRRRAVEEAFFAPGNDASAWEGGWWPDAAPGQASATMATPVDAWWFVGEVPLLVVQGLQDVVAPPENGRRAVADHSQSRLVEIDRAGHALLPEQPGAVERALLDFLAQVEAGVSIR